LDDVVFLDRTIWNTQLHRDISQPELTNLRGKYTLCLKKCTNFETV